MFQARLIQGNILKKVIDAIKDLVVTHAVIVWPLVVGM